MVLVEVCFAKALPPTRLCARAPSAVRSFALTPLVPWSRNFGRGRRGEARGSRRGGARTGFSSGAAAVQGRDSKAGTGGRTASSTGTAVSVDCEN